MCELKKIFFIFFIFMDYLYIEIMKIILNKEDILTYGKEKTEYYINLHEKNKQNYYCGLKILKNIVLMLI